MITRLAAVSVAAVAVATAWAAPVAPTVAFAASSSAPIDDPAANGYLGFCDATHHQVRSGSLAAAPFAWTIVASEPAPDGYAKGKASVYAYQPRPDTSPAEWSGKQLTASSTFTNKRHPMSSGTRVDPALVDFTATYTPQVKGLVQLRMIFTAGNRPQYPNGYPAVFVRVTGTTWTQVGGGTVDCDAGSARSVELDALSASRLKVRNPRPAPQSAEQIARQTTADASGSAAASPSSSATTAARTGADAAASSVNAGAAAAQRGDGTDGDALTLWLVVAGAVVLGAGGFVAYRRSRPSA